MKKASLIIASTLQILIITVMITQSILPLLTGKEISLKVIPRDPRDIFRGNYVRLRYDFNRLKISDTPNDFNINDKFYFGDQLYLKLEKDGKVYNKTGIYKLKPKGLVLKVIVKNSYTHKDVNGYNYLYIKSGLESYYTDIQNAKKIEKDVQNQKVKVIVKAMVTQNGDSRIKDLVYVNQLK